MVACLEKTEENAEFHQIVDFLSTCSINYALTVSPTIYASYIEQFWNTAISKTVNSVKQIHAIVDGKVVVISKSSVRSDLLFNDEDGIACLTNAEIFKNLALMGYEQISTKLTVRIRRLHYNLIPAESKFKNLMLDHQDKYMMKAQHILRGRLLASFQDLENEGDDTRSQGGIKDNDSKIKIQVHSSTISVVMSADSAVTYSFVHSEARSLSIPSEDPYEEATQQLFEQAPHSLEYAPRDHVPVFVPEFEHPEDLCQLRRRHLHLSYHQDFYHPTRLRDTEWRMMAALELVKLRVSYQVDVCTKESSEFCTRHHDAQKDRAAVRAEIEKDRAAVRAEIEVLRSERLAYEQEGIQNRDALARSEAYCKALEVRVAVLETHARRLEWQRQAVDDLVVQHRNPSSSGWIIEQIPKLAALYHHKK
nr:xylulose kinase-1 [Tanacetum cinerariifolium]